MTLTLTLILPALFGATIGRASLKRLASLDRKKLEHSLGTWNYRLAEWLQAVWLLPFVVYQTGYAGVLIVASVLFAIFPLLSIVPLFFFAPGLLCFLCPVIVIVSIHRIARAGLQPDNFSALIKQRITWVISIMIICTELITTSANDPEFTILDNPRRFVQFEKSPDIAALIQSLRSQDYYASVLARNKLSQLGDPAAMAVLPLVNSENRQLQAHAIYVLIKTGHINDLIKQYSHSLSVLYCLEEIADSSDYNVKEVASEQLNKLAQTDREWLIDALRTEELRPDLEISLIQILRRSGSDGFGQILEILGNKKGEIAPGTASELSKFGDIVIPELIKALKQNHTKLNSLAVMSLAHIGWPAVSLLSDLLKDAEYRKKALETLMMIDDKRTTPILIDEFKRSQNVKILIALWERKDGKAINFLQELSQSSDPRIREMAHAVLSQKEIKFHEQMDVPSR